MTCLIYFHRIFFGGNHGRKERSPRSRKEHERTHLQMKQLETHAHRNKQTVAKQITIYTYYIYIYIVIYNIIFYTGTLPKSECTDSASGHRPRWPGTGATACPEHRALSRCARWSSLSRPRSWRARPRALDGRRRRWGGSGIGS